MSNLTTTLLHIIEIDHLLLCKNDEINLFQKICEHLVEIPEIECSVIHRSNSESELTCEAKAGKRHFLQIVLQIMKGKQNDDNNGNGVRNASDIVRMYCIPADQSNFATKEKSILAVQLTIGNDLFGYLSVMMSHHIASQKDIIRIFGNLGENISCCLQRIKHDEKRKKLENDYKQNRLQLGERVKELKCLYAISRLMEKKGIALEEIFRGTLGFIQPAWQYPDITCARIVYDNLIFKTDNYMSTSYIQSSDIIVNGEKRGFAEVGYLKKTPRQDEGPFLKEERALLNNIAERLGKIAEHIQIQEALREREKNFRDLVESSLVGIAIILESRIVYMNSEQERLSGSLLRVFTEMNLNMVHTDDKEKVKDRVTRILEKTKRQVNFDFRFYPNPSEEEKDLKWVYCKASLVAYQGQEALLINMMDVTRLKHLETLLRIKDKMVSLGHVTAGIAHEIRNPLSGINIYLNALEKINRENTNSEKVTEILNQIQSASGKIESVIRRVMDFSKPTEPKLVLSDINQPIEEAIQLSSVTLRKVGIQLNTHLVTHLPKCYADSQLIEQVLLNLITNAAEAMRMQTAEKRIEVSSSFLGGNIVIKVSDSGPGVPSVLKEKIFDPFYSTKKGSTGIGLSLGHRIITDHKGTLEVGVSRWGGAEFVIYLPIHKQV